jgi:ketosteroid isomerase-like protein
MTADDVKAFFEDLSRGDVSALEPRLAEDVVLEFPGSRFGGKQEGRRRVVVFLKQNQRLFEGGLLFDVRWAGVVGDRAVAQWTNAGITKDGTPYANRGVTVFTVRTGPEGERIVRIEDYLDTERLAATWPK